MTGQAFDPGPPVDYAWAGDFLERFVRARADGAVSAIVALFADDAGLLPGPFHPALEGANAIRAYFLQRASEEADLDLTVERHWVSGATILAAWHASYLRRPDGGISREAGFVTAEIRSGLCVRMRFWTEAKSAGQ